MDAYIHVMTNSTDAQVVRFASYNIRKARGLDQRRDPGRIVDVINGLNADVIALQEADRRLGDRPAALPHRLVAEHTDFEVLPVARSEVSLGWHGNAMLVRKGLAVSDVVPVELPGLEPRGAVRFTARLERPVTVVGTHLGLVRRHRRQQLGSIAAQLTGAEDAVILGDFNEWSPTKGLEPLGDGFNVLSPGRSFHAARPMAALDRIAHSHDLAIADAGVEQGALARRASDHLPVWADIRLNRAA